MKSNSDRGDGHVTGQQWLHRLTPRVEGDLDRFIVSPLQSMPINSISLIYTIKFTHTFN